MVIEGEGGFDLVSQMRSQSFPLEIRNLGGSEEPAICFLSGYQDQFTNLRVFYDHFFRSFFAKNPLSNEFYSPSRRVITK